MKHLLLEHKKDLLNFRKLKEICNWDWSQNKAAEVSGKQEKFSENAEKRPKKVRYKEENKRDVEGPFRRYDLFILRIL